MRLPVTNVTAVVEVITATSFGIFVTVAGTFVLSIGDVCSDVAVVISWFKSGRVAFAEAVLACMVINLAAQVVVTLLQNHKKRVGDVGREMFLVFTSLAPAVHGWRSYTGKAQHPLDKISHNNLHIFFKCSEIGFEAVPGLVVQLLCAVSSFGSEPLSTAQVTSITISTTTIAFGVSQMFYEKDLDPVLRKLNPSFYGVLPTAAHRRHAAMFCLMAFNISHVFGKCLGLSLLWETFGWRVTSGLWLADFAFFCGVKLARRDYVYWLNFDGYVPSILFSMIARLAQKILVDFTAFLHLRHAYEVGGAHYSVSLLWSQLTSIASAVLYVHHFDPVDPSHKIRPATLYAIVGSVAATWLLFFLIFLLLIDRRYTATFFSTETGHQLTAKSFIEGDDYQKQDIFTVNPMLWSQIKEDVRDWSLGNWATWTQTKPHWFTTDFISRVPDEFIPVNMAPPRLRRRSSLLRGLGGGGQTVMPLLEKEEQLGALGGKVESAAEGGREGEKEHDDDEELEAGGVIGRDAEEVQMKG